jgi:nitroreductase
MDFYEVVLKRRSVRDFKLDQIPQNTLNRVLEAGRWAPSGANLQPWRLIVVTRSAVKAAIAEICTTYSKAVWKAFTPGIAKFLGSRGGTWNKSYMNTIPVLLAVCYRISHEPMNQIALASTWTAIQNILLAAANEDLGSCIYTHANSEEEDALKQTLAIPRAYHLAAIIQLGYPKTIPPTPPRKRLDEIISYEHF